MKKICITIAAILFSAQQSNSFFFLDLGSFLQPILNPKVDIFGEATYRNDYLGIDTTQSFGSPILGSILQGLNPASKDGSLRRDTRKEEQKKSDMNANDIYKAIGIPEDVIYSKILPVHMEARRNLNRYFYKLSISSYELYKSMKKLKQLIKWINDTYLKDVNNVVLGDNNAIQGQNIFVKGENQNVEGQSNYVFNPNYGNKKISGDNIVRISKFDIDLDKIERIRWNPYEAIKLLEGYF